MDKPPRPSRTEVFLNYKIWLSSITGNGQINDSAFRLLEEIALQGKISAAADALNLKFSEALEMVISAEKVLGYPLLASPNDYNSGENSQLTPSCLKLLEAYKALQEPFDENVEEALKVFNEKKSKTQSNK